MLIALIAVAWLALVALGLSLCRVAARTDAAHAATVDGWLGTDSVGELEPDGDDCMLELPRTRANRGL